MKENDNGLLIHASDSGMCEDPLAYEATSKDGLWKAPKNKQSLIMDSFTFGNDNERTSILPSSLPSEILKKDLYAEETVAQSKLPGLIACYDEGDHDSIKDICIDEGIPSEGMQLIENGSKCDEVDCSDFDKIKRDLDAKFLSLDGPIPSRKDGDKNSANENGRGGMVVDLFSPESPRDVCISVPIDDVEVLSQGTVDAEVPVHNGRENKKDGSNNLYENDRGKRAEQANDLGGLKSSKESDTKDQDAGNYVQTGEESSNVGGEVFDAARTEDLVSSSTHPVKETRPMTSLKFLLESSSHDDFEAGKPTGESAVGQVSKSTDSGVAESTRTEQTNKLPYDGRVESEIIAFSFDSAKAISSTREGAPKADPLLESQNAPSHEDGYSGTLSTERGGGESSFSMAGPVSGLITYSGPIAFSGSISVRSDSSTTSTRSFAFPILQNEWNSSPVKMAKADRSRFRKLRGWRQGLLCCRF